MTYLMPKKRDILGLTLKYQTLKELDKSVREFATVKVLNSSNSMI